MHHLYPLSKGDPLCPLGFHPQVRWPTRCKRCFRDYKDHDGKKKTEEKLGKTDSTASSPNLNLWDYNDSKLKQRVWSSSSNLARDSGSKDSEYQSAKSSQSDCQTDSKQHFIPTVSLTLPRRKNFRSPLQRTVSDSVVEIPNIDSYRIQNEKQIAKEAEKSKKLCVKEIKVSENSTSNDVQFLIQLKTLKEKKSAKDKLFNTADGTNRGNLKEATESEEIRNQSFKNEKKKEEKSIIKLKNTTETIEQPEKLNDLQNQIELLNSDRNNLQLKVKQLENELKLTSSTFVPQKNLEELKSKLSATEALCEELLDENETVKKELRGLEDEMDEMQDNFREDQFDENSSLKRELEQATKNCRILSFKLRKSERRVELIEFQKYEAEKKLNEINSTVENVGKLKNLEQEVNDYKLAKFNLEKDINDAQSQLKESERNANNQKLEKPSQLQKNVISNELLMKCGSKDDVKYRQKDLQDSLERAADLREQLRFSEEESQNLRKIISRIEEENESLVLQLKNLVKSKDCSTLNDKDSNKFKLLLDISERENSLLRDTIKELDSQEDNLKRKLKHLYEKSAEHDVLEKNDSSILENCYDEDEQMKIFLSRKPKLVKETTSKVQLKKMVTELENEVGVLVNALKRAVQEKSELKRKNSSKLQLKENKELQNEISRTPIINEHDNSLKEKIELLNNELQSKEAALQKLNSELQSATTKLKKYSQNSGYETKKKIDQHSEKQDDVLQKKITQLEKKLSEEQKKLQDKEKEMSVMSAEAIKDKTVSSQKIEKLTKEIGNLRNEINTNKETIISFENNLRKQKELHSQQNSKVEADFQTKINDFIEKNKMLEKESSILHKEKAVLTNRLDEAETNLKNEKIKNEKVIESHEKQNTTTSVELKFLQTKIIGLQQESASLKKRMKDMKDNYEKRIEEMVKDMNSTKGDCEKYLEKYEMLEEEFVATKAKLVMENESLKNEVTNLQKEINKSKQELQLLRNSNNFKDGSQNKIIKAKESNDVSTNIKLTSLMSSLEEKKSQLIQIQKENEVVYDQIQHLRRENDELKKKLDDYEKVSRFQRNMSAESTALEKQLQQLRTKLTSAEEAKRNEVAECKQRYKIQIKVVNDEVKSLQSELEVLKKDRDTLKLKLDNAQKTITNNNQSNTKTGKKVSSSTKESEHSKMKISTLEQHIKYLEDELSESRVEVSKVKSEFISEKSTWQVTLSELQSRINELEEERSLTSGRAKIVGIRTKLELAWQKERQEQQRILQETSTLARDLRQTLFEVEKERDRERLEAKRKQEQLKKTLDDEQEDHKKKTIELQGDLLELRDAYAKLRETNEKYKLDRERNERHKDLIIPRKRVSYDEDKNARILIKEVEGHTISLIDLLSREGGKLPEKEKSFKETNTNTSQIVPALHRLNETLLKIKTSNPNYLGENDKRKSRQISYTRRAASTELDYYLGEKSHAQKKLKKNQRSISLEQVLNRDMDKRKGQNDSVSNLDYISDTEVRWKRDGSIDSRLSGDSTQSDIGTGKHKTEKSFFSKLRMLTKSRSMDDKDQQYFSSSKKLSKQSPSGSDDMSSEQNGSKSDLKGMIVNMFKRAGSSSRSNSQEKLAKHDTSSTQRPLMPHRSNDDIS